MSFFARSTAERTSSRNSTTSFWATTCLSLASVAASLSTSATNGARAPAAERRQPVLQVAQLVDDLRVRRRDDGSVAQQQLLARRAFALGLSTRVGLEDGAALPDGTPAADNAALVRAALALRAQ